MENGMAGSQLNMWLNHPDNIPSTVEEPQEYSATPISQVALLVAKPNMSEYHTETSIS